MPKTTKDTIELEEKSQKAKATVKAKTTSKKKKTARRPALQKKVLAKKL